MSADATQWRIEGVYAQAQPGCFMVRAKVPGGTLSAAQASALADLADRFGDGMLHLTTRMSVELHGVAEPELPEVTGALRAAGLPSRGACGGAVRGVAVSAPEGPGGDPARALARALHARFLGDPEFEGLPKKFKIGVEAGYAGSRHLIQDLGLVWAGPGEAGPRWDAWLAGGLGRAPAEAFRIAEALPLGDVLPLAEAVLRVYKARCPPGKRLKHLAAELGRQALADLVGEALGRSLPLPGELSDPHPTRPDADAPVVAHVFAGQLAPHSLRALARVAQEHAHGVLLLTPDQDVALAPGDPAERRLLVDALAAIGFADRSPEDRVTLRVCPGSHDCRLGLAPTRDVARALLSALGPAGQRLTWAVSGCPNGCAQPQLAEAGVVCRRAGRGPGGETAPLFDLLRGSGNGFAVVARERVPLAELVEEAQALG